jgi:hypothetical protein
MVKHGAGWAAHLRQQRRFPWHGDFGLNPWEMVLFYLEGAICMLDALVSVWELYLGGERWDGG